MKEGSQVIPQSECVNRGPIVREVEAWLESLKVLNENAQTGLVNDKSFHPQRAQNVPKFFSMSIQG